MPPLAWRAHQSACSETSQQRAHENEFRVQSSEFIAHGNEPGIAGAGAGAGAG